jgi:hypothetical protein
MVQLKSDMEELYATKAKCNVRIKITRGLVFAHLERVQWLKRRGHLTQFDATYKTDAWGHNLFSSPVRNEEKYLDSRRSLCGGT